MQERWPQEQGERSHQRRAVRGDQCHQRYVGPPHRRVRVGLEEARPRWCQVGEGETEARDERCDEEGDRCRLESLELKNLVARKTVDEYEMLSVTKRSREFMANLYMASQRGVLLSRERIKLDFDEIHLSSSI